MILTMQMLSGLFNVGKGGQAYVYKRSAYT